LEEFGGFSEKGEAEQGQRQRATKYKNVLGRKRKKMPGKSGARYERRTGDMEIRVKPRGSEGSDKSEK